MKPVKIQTRPRKIDTNAYVSEVTLQTNGFHVAGAEYVNLLPSGPLSIALCGAHQKTTTKNQNHVARGTREKKQQMKAILREIRHG